MTHQEHGEMMQRIGVLMTPSPSRFRAFFEKIVRVCSAITPGTTVRVDDLVRKHTVPAFVDVLRWIMDSDPYDPWAATLSIDGDSLNGYTLHRSRSYEGAKGRGDEWKMEKFGGKQENQELSNH